ncbi:MAG: DciA family protein [Pseudomonadota bacterium]
MTIIIRCQPFSVMLRAFANRLETRIIFTQPPYEATTEPNVPHRLNAFLASNHELRLLSSKAEQIAVLQKHYDSFLPASLKRNSQVLQLRQQTLVIAAPSGAMAAKLRQMTGELISLFQARGCEVTGIQIKVQVRSTHPPARTPPRKPGAGARTAVEELGQTLSDSPLRSALMRLAKRI